MLFRENKFGSPAENIILRKTKLRKSGQKTCCRGCWYNMVFAPQMPPFKYIHALKTLTSDIWKVIFNKLQLMIKVTEKVKHLVIFPSSLPCTQWMICKKCWQFRWGNIWPYRRSTQFWLARYNGCLWENFFSSSVRILVCPKQVRIRGRGGRGPGPTLIQGFEAPKLSIFGPYLIFS